jgi:hypothetical protein
MKRFGTTNDRNYDKEAREMLRQLSMADKYKMYEIVLNQQSRSSNDERVLELEAVRRVIETDRSLDKHRLHKLREGEQGMSAEITGHDLIANNKPKKKKA